ncbi:MAG: hypothetical protein O3C05_02120 [Proteobacteria bacterium]|nr:hypothetical protein [Pseudomonadota bacterium]
MYLNIIKLLQFTFFPSVAAWACSGYCRDSYKFCTKMGISHLKSSCEISYSTCIQAAESAIKARCNSDYTMLTSCISDAQSRITSDCLIPFDSCWSDCDPIFGFHGPQ